MAWFKVDDRLWSHPKWLNTPPAARGLWVTAGSWCADHEQDGFISRSSLRILGHTPRHADALVVSGLWSECDDGWMFHNWIEFQPTRAELQARRTLRAEAGRAGGQASGRSRREASASQTVEQTRSKPEAKTNPVPSPVPDPTTPNGVVTPRATRDHPIPDDWTPGTDHAARATETGLDPEREHIKFRAHAEEKGRKAKNWNAAFTRWLMQAAEYAERDTKRGAPILDRQGELLKQEMTRARAADAANNTQKGIAS